MNYSHYAKTRNLSQLDAVPGKDMLQNNAGGFAFKVNKWEQLDRFLVLGTESGTYYVEEKDLTLQNFEALDSCIAEDAIRVVDRAVELSVTGRAPKNDPALFVLAKVCAESKHARSRRYALDKLPQVARTGTHLLHFAEYANSLRGWGRALKRGIANWYSDKTVEQVALQVAKYKQRDGWSHGDLLRLAHPKTKEQARNRLYGKITHPETKLAETDHKGLEFYRAAESASVELDPKRCASLIRAFRLPRECVNTQLLNDKQVWNALLENMPMTALLRNLGKIASMGMTPRYSKEAENIVKQLTQGDALKKARVHPISILSALNVYKLGRGIKGSLNWEPNREIIEALNDAFYLAFQNVVPTKKRHLLGIDISGSMYCNSVNGIAGLDAATAAAAMALVTLHAEQNVILKAFTAGHDGGYWYRSGAQPNLTGFIDLNVSRRMLLDQVIEVMQKHDFGATDCSLPMIWATKNKVPVDAFVVYTDCETWAGTIHPFQALQNYRKAMNIPAKLIVAGVSANDVSIADPSDAGMMDVVGFDSAAPNIMSDFIAGNRSADL